MPQPPSEPPVPELIDDLMDLTLAEHMELSLAAPIASGAKPNGNSNLSFQNAATQYDVPRE